VFSYAKKKKSGCRGVAIWLLGYSGIWICECYLGGFYFVSICPSGSSFNANNIFGPFHCPAMEDCNFYGLCSMVLMCHIWIYLTMN